ncbi:MAG: alpha/beta hydrolase [Rhizobiaceae bacterium]|nr:alpha/beta hydrolase [Rhizobiaceae bacterium]MCV0408554.1 alpha/beta hydrolase [Rhizobiaceae bacterium]
MHLRFLAAAFSILIALGIAGSQTIPEIILFRDRLLTTAHGAEADLPMVPVDITTRDGLVLRSWYHAPDPYKPVIVYFPGRIGDFGHRSPQLAGFVEKGYGLVLAGYRGYGGNPGRPSETRLYQDAEDLVAKLETLDLAPNGLVLYGYSMGTSVASWLAEKGVGKGVILEAPFTSFAAVVNHAVSAVPGWLVRSRFDTASRMAAIHSPVLLLAGEDDRLTPPVFAEGLAALNEVWAVLRIMPHAAHDTIVEHGALDIIAEFLEGLVAPAAAVPLDEPLAGAGDWIVPAQP